MAGQLVGRVATELSGALGIPAQNAEIMAGNMIRLARNQPGEATFVRAAGLFGKFDQPFLVQLRQTILASEEDVSQPSTASASASASLSALASTSDSTDDRLEPAQPLRAGLQKFGGDVRTSASACLGSFSLL